MVNSEDQILDLREGFSEPGSIALSVSMMV